MVKEKEGSVSPSTDSSHWQHILKPQGAVHVLHTSQFAGYRAEWRVEGESREANENYRSYYKHSRVLFLQIKLLLEPCLITRRSNNAEIIICIKSLSSLICKSRIKPLPPKVMRVKSDHEYGVCTPLGIS